MPNGVYAKDVILEIIRRLTVNGATDRVIEFAGTAVDAMSMEERMTLCPTWPSRPGRPPGSACPTA